MANCRVRRRWRFYTLPHAHPATAHAVVSRATVANGTNSVRPVRVTPTIVRQKLLAHLVTSCIPLRVFQSVTAWCFSSSVAPSRLSSVT
jgi:hypothetical protein